MVDSAAGGPQGGASQTQPGVWVDPYRAYNFRVEIKGLAEAHFTACSGIDVAVEPIRYRAGGMGPVVHAVPGPVDYGEVTLHYGITASREVWSWFVNAMSGQADRREVSIVLLDTNHVDELIRWDLYGAWPSRWVGAPLDALGREVAIATLTLVFEQIEYQ